MLLSPQVHLAKSFFLFVSLTIVPNNLCSLVKQTRVSNIEIFL